MGYFYLESEMVMITGSLDWGGFFTRLVLISPCILGSLNGEGMRKQRMKHPKQLKVRFKGRKLLNLGMKKQSQCH